MYHCTDVLWLTCVTYGVIPTLCTHAVAPKVAFARKRSSVFPPKNVCVGVDPWFGTAIITLAVSGGAITTVPIHKGFSVSKTAEGKIDNAMSDELKGMVEDIFAKAPTCSAAKARHLRRSVQLCG